MSHTINDLREHLFATLEGLRDKDAPMDIERARAVAEVAQAVINSAKVEVEHLKISGAAEATGFIPSSVPALPGTTTTRDPQRGTVTTIEQRGSLTVTRHTAK